MVFFFAPTVMHTDTFLPCLSHTLLHDDVQVFRNRASASLAQNARDATMNPANIFILSWCRCFSYLRKICGNASLLHLNAVEEFLFLWDRTEAGLTPVLAFLIMHGQKNIV